MPKIRSIKPEICTSPAFVACSRDARLTFTLMWTHCDDAGVHPADLGRLKMEIFPADNDVDSPLLDVWIGELLDQGLLLEYRASNGRTYWAVEGWHHQKITRPAFRFPRPSKPGTMFTERSASSPRLVDQDLAAANNVPGPMENQGLTGKTAVSQQCRNTAAAVSQQCSPPPGDRRSEIGDRKNAPPRADARAALWDMGVAALGGPERSARALIGKMVKEHGEKKVATVLAEMTVSEKAEPRSWFTAACSRGGNVVVLPGGGNRLAGYER